MGVGMVMVLLFLWGVFTLMVAIICRPHEYSFYAALILGWAIVTFGPMIPQ